MIRKFKRTAFILNVNLLQLVFTVTFNEFNASLLNINSSLKQILWTPNI